MVGKKEKYLVAAQKFIERGQYDKALGEFARVVEEDPKDTRTWLKMAELHAKRGANSEATEIYLRMGDLYSEQGFAQKAVAVYKNVLKLSPGTLSAHLKLGALFKQLGLIQDAVQQLELAAGALQRNQKLVDGVATLRQAMEIQPDNVVLRVKLAEAASQAGLTDEAVREFARAADQLKAQGRVDESLRVVERLLFHQPDNYNKARELAEAYIAKGSARLALPKLQACLNGDPRDPRTLSLLAKALEQLGQTPKAVSVLKELIRLCDDLGRATERDAALLRALTLAPTDGELRALANRQQTRGGSGGVVAASSPLPYAEALGGSTFEISGAVRMPAGANASGRVSIPIGLGESSGPGVGIALPANSDVERLMAEADVFVKYGLLERAVDHFGRVFDLDPGYRPAREKLITVLRQLGRGNEAAQHAAILQEQTAPPERHPPAFALDVEDIEDVAEVEPADEADDPSAAMLTPPPVSSRGLRLDVELDDGPATPPPLTSSAAFDVNTGDVVIDAPEFELSSGAIATSLEVDDDEDEVTIGRAPAPVSRRLDVDDAADQVTPPPGATVRSSGPVTLAVDEDDEVEGDLDEDLDQVSFFIGQSLTDEARALLRDIERRHPGSPRIAAVLRELQAVEARLDARMMKAAGRPARAQATPAVQRRGQAAAGTSGPPRALVDGGDADLDTRADLAIAYKEMGLYDAAIAELKEVAEDPGREVFALTTMGECFEAKGVFTDAISRYKRALNCEQITVEERLALYYLLGGAFERLGDVGEALYFFEMVAKRSPHYRDVEERVADLRPRMVKRAR